MRTDLSWQKLLLELLTDTRLYRRTLVLASVTGTVAVVVFLLVLMVK